MRCPKHPDTQRLPKQPFCFLCQDWSNGQSAVVESDIVKFERNRMARHVDPTLTGDYSTRGKYQRLLKSRGLTDDIGHKELCQAVVNTAKRERVREAAIAQVVERLREPCVRGASRPAAVRTSGQRQLWNRLTMMSR